MEFRVASNYMPEEKKTELYSLVKAICQRLATKVSDRFIFDQLINNGKQLERSDLVSNEAPEGATEEVVIEPILEFLGFKDHPHKTTSGSSVSKDEADYTIAVGNQRMLMESEPLNKDLLAPRVGVKQLGRYLENRSFASDFGIATNGLRWILVAYNTEEYATVVILDVDLTPIFQENLGQTHLSDVNEILRDFYFGFRAESVRDTVRRKAGFLKESKEEITKRFYQDYIKYVFGYDKKSGKHYYCLLDAITSTSQTDLPDENKRLFAVTLMNRLIFIKFLEDKGLVSKNLLGELLKEYMNSPKPSSYYQMYLFNLFYDVFNTDFAERKSHVQSNPFFKNIPYLNGGLFREAFPSERDLDVDNSILEKVISDLLERYTFALKGDPESLDPDVLGNVFEKTINYLTNPDTTDKRKEKGAYYTGDDITSFLAKNTIHPFLLEQIKIVLRSVAGWSQADVDTYPTVESFLDTPPSTSPRTIKKIVESLDRLKLIDPACGSGHFLTSALKELFFIKRRLLEMLGEGIDPYVIKRSIINMNLYGVDIEVTAVEIAKLRLWLSLIEDLNASDIAHIETLPNIDYNIVTGNSLVGWFDEDIKQTMATVIYDQRVDGIFVGLEFAFASDPTKLKMLSESKHLLLAGKGKGMGNRLVDLKKAYSVLREIYTSEEGKKALKLREVLETVRTAIYAQITPFMKSYITLRQKGRVSSKGPIHPIIPRMDVGNLFHWNLDFGEVLDKGGFDIVIGNPPYGVELEKWERAYIKKSLVFTPKLMTSEMAFMEKSTKLVKNGGYVGLIVPKALAYSQKWSVAREMIREDLDAIVDVSKAFKDVKHEMVVFVAKKGGSSKTYRIMDIQGANCTRFDKKYVDQTNTLVLHPNALSLAIYEKMSDGATFLSSISQTSRGLPFQKHITKTPTPYKVYRGRHISRFFLAESNEYLPASCVKVDSDKVEYILQPKVISQNIVAHIKRPHERIEIMAYLDREGVLDLDTVMNTVLTDKRYSLEFLTCLLNSNLVSWFAYHYIFADAIRDMHFDEYYIGKIPLPKTIPPMSTFKKFAETIEQQGRQRFKKSSKLSQRRISGDSKGIYDELNAFVYRIYGLDRNDINIIEGEL